jgi:type II restriction/modification system DNA methylase subunit YeeA
MNLSPKSPEGAFGTSEKEFQEFRRKVFDFLRKVNPKESEEHNKNHLRDFLKEAFYTPEKYLVNTSGDIDLAIYDGTDPKSNVAVIFEVKSPSNTNEMITAGSLDRRGFLELVFYYLREKLDNKNDFIKHLVITNCLQWFVFDATDFNRIFYRNAELRNDYEKWRNKQTDDTTTKFMYEKISEFINSSDETIPCYYIDLAKLHSDLLEPEEEILRRFYALLSPQVLLKLRPAYLGSALNREFYNELLYILGLQEVERGGIFIERLPEGKRLPGSLIENTIERLEEMPSNKGEPLFEIALELVITWLNRILFLKLLEGQLITHSPNAAFLTKGTIQDFDTLNELFFDVLAIPEEQRKSHIVPQFKQVPFLNSSLFEKTKYEEKYFSIDALRSRYTLPYYSRTILKDDYGRQRTGDEPTLNYLLDFLNAYNFSSADQAQNNKDETKTIINAAVLGLIFEKINGYKDGSYFTPAFISMFMARLAIRTQLLRLFNTEYGWNANDFEDLPNYIKLNVNRESILRYNRTVNSIRICDPAVGSGHFLVACLNELIAAKSLLGILADEGGYVLPITAKVENDELLFVDREGKPFVYNPKDRESNRIQKTIFEEKRRLIENCLFGVDINPKSVQITRLRLWIELLKNAYYKDDGKLETLPNIDLNIKEGDSLLSRLSLDDTAISVYNAELIAKYKQLVREYKNESDKQRREKILKEIENTKRNLRQQMISKSNLWFKVRKLEDDIKNLRDENQLFKYSGEEIKQRLQKAWELEQEKKRLEEQIEAEEKELAQRNYFEWRIEFPEVLDDNGNYVGFDIVIGNPPYIQLQKAYDSRNKYADRYKAQNYQTFARTGDIYCLFYERGLQLLKNDGILAFITSNKWMRAGYGELLRSFFLKYNPLFLVDIGPNVFEHATVDTAIFVVQKSPNRNQLRAAKLEVDDILEAGDTNKVLEQLQSSSVVLTKLSKDAWFIGTDAEQRLKEKIERIGKPLKDWDVKIYRGVLTGLNEAFIITTEKRKEILANCRSEEERRRTEAIIKPILRGRDIKRYYYEWAGLWVIIIPAGWTNENRGKRKAEEFIKEQFPSLMSYLKVFESKAKKRDDQGDYWWELRACAYYPEFEKEKVVWNRITNVIFFSFDDKNYFVLDSTFFITGNDLKYLNGVLNSTVSKKWIKMSAATLGEGSYGAKIYIENLPIPPITKENEWIAREIEALVDKILAAKKQDKTADTSAWEREIDGLVYELYGLSAEEKRIVEGAP